MTSIGKTPVLCAAAFGLLCAAAAAAPATAPGTTEFGRVISSTPVVVQVPSTHRECAEQPVPSAAPSPAPRAKGGAGADSKPGAGSAGGTLAGAAIGAAIGHVVGDMFGGSMSRAAATGIGMIAGAAIADHAEAQAAAAQAQADAAAAATRCRDVTLTESRVTGYDVVYEYQGVQRTVRLPQPPGERIALEVNLVPVGAVPPQAPAAPVAAGVPPTAPADPAYRSPADRPGADDRVPPAPAPRAQAPNPWPYVVAAGVGAVILSEILREIHADAPRHGRHPKRGR